VGRLVRWLLGPDEPRVPGPEETVEVAWLPLWQCQLVLHALWEADIPAVVSEDHTSHLRFAALVPMGRIFVLGFRLEAARTLVAEVIGDEPVPQHR
jgi:hypothetical protein